MKEWIEFEERNEWSDVKPIQEYEDKCSVGKMKYSNRCNLYLVASTMNMFRSILNSNEKSKRAFDLTTEIIRLSPSFYIAWHYRRYLLVELNYSTQDELRFLSEQSKLNPKNYQVWYYRKFLLDKADILSELAFIDEILNIDERNVHAWGHRQLLTKRNQLWESELRFISNFLNLNPRNHSAWSYRYFLITNKSAKDLLICNSELEFSWTFAENILNESCYKYIEQFYNFELSECIKFKLNEIIKTQGISPPLLQLFLSIYQKENNKEMAMLICHKLKQVDSIHEKYWSFRMKECAGKNLSRTLEDRNLCSEINDLRTEKSVMWIYFSNKNS